jgi:predicted PurR-regulated permease PerM
MKTTNTNKITENKVIHSALQLIALALLLIWCYKIIQPFTNIIVWSTMLAIALFPLQVKLTSKLKGRNILSAVIITLLMLLLVVGPLIGFILASINEINILTEMFQSGNLNIPIPKETIKDWPVFGDKLYQNWSDASNNLTLFISKHKDELEPVVMKILSLLSSAGTGIALLLASIIISGIFLVYASPLTNFAEKLFIKLAGEYGKNMANSAAKTVRNVAKGVLGVSFIQAILAGIGLTLAGVPLAGVWTLLCLVFAIIQVGVFPVTIGVIIYIWGAADTTTAVLLTIWMIFIGALDNILKPILMGKGAPAPMLIVFIGAIGGFIANGFIALFTGAIVFTIAYNLLTSWLNNGNFSEEELENVSEQIEPTIESPPIIEENQI